jgi:hypothetical protein
MRQTCLDILMGEFRLGECTGQEGYFTPAWSKRAGWIRIENSVSGSDFDFGAKLCPIMLIPQILREMSFKRVKADNGYRSNLHQPSGPN